MKGMALLNGLARAAHTTAPLEGLVAQLYEVESKGCLANPATLPDKALLHASTLVDKKGAFRFDVPSKDGIQWLIALQPAGTGTGHSGEAPLWLSTVNIPDAKSEYAVSIAVPEAALEKAQGAKDPHRWFVERIERSAEKQNSIRTKLKALASDATAKRQASDTTARELLRAASNTRGKSTSKGHFVQSRKDVPVAAEAAALETIAQLSDYQLRQNPKMILRISDAVLRKHRLRPEDLEAPVTFDSLCDLLGTDANPVLRRIRDKIVTPTTSNAPSPEPPPGSAGDGGEDIEAHAKRRVLERLEAMKLSQTPGATSGSAADWQALGQRLQQVRVAGGPADVPAFHDFHHLQLATNRTWTAAFDAKTANAALDLWWLVTRLHEDYGVAAPGPGEFDDVESFQRLLSMIDRRLSNFSFAPPPEVVEDQYPWISWSAWNALSPSQMYKVNQLANARDDLIRRNLGEAGASLLRDNKGQVVAIISNPQGKLGRAQQMLMELRESTREPYAFQYFAPDSTAWGILVSYRQKWTPESYQIGDLVKTVPLAPGEVRRMSLKQVQRSSQSRKQQDASQATQKLDHRGTSSAEQQILDRASASTSFSTSVSGGADFGVGKIGATTAFGFNQASDSARVKRQFREAVVTSAQEYRRDFKIEVEIQETTESEAVSSGEIANANNEITVTYLFYELQRRYRIEEDIQQVTPVVLVAQDMPAPHEIDDDWLAAHAWILRKVLLDPRMAAALDELPALPGHEAAKTIIQAEWETQKQLVESLEASIARQMLTQESLQALLARAHDGNLIAESDAPDDLQIAAEAFFTGGLSMLMGKRDEDTARLEAQKEAVKLRLEHVADALVELRSRLGRESAALENATRRYTEATQQGFDRRTRSDVLRAHVKQNILHYMQAIWDHEPPDQRYFRLHDTLVFVPEPEPGSCTIRRAREDEVTGGTLIYRDGERYTVQCSAPSRTPVPKFLVDLADLDRPLGYKGNYIIFPLRKCTHLTDFMVQEYVDGYFGVRDPDELSEFDLDSLVSLRTEHAATLAPDEKNALERLIAERLKAGPRSSTIVVPTGELFIEALPGTQPLLEPFKQAHRVFDLARAESDLRAAEFENLRRALRLGADELEDPDIERHTVVTGTRFHVESDV